MLLINVHSQLSKTYLLMESEKIDRNDAKQRLEYVENAIEDLTQAITLIRHRLDDIYSNNDNDGENQDDGDDNIIEETICSDLEEKMTQMRYECFLCYIKKSQIHV